jgi:hypothetical protein
MEVIVPPKRRITYGLHGVICHKMTTFISVAVRTSNSTQFTVILTLKWRTLLLKHLLTVLDHRQKANFYRPRQVSGFLHVSNFWAKKKERLIAM